MVLLVSHHGEEKMETVRKKNVTWSFQPSYSGCSGEDNVLRRAWEMRTVKHLLFQGLVPEINFKISFFCLEDRDINDELITEG